MRRALPYFIAFFGLVLIVTSYFTAQLIGQANSALRSVSTMPAAPMGVLKRHVALIIPDNRTAYFDTLVASMDQAGARADMVVQVFRYRAFQPEEARNFLEIAIDARLHGLVYYPLDTDDGTPWAERCKEAGIRFLSIGSDEAGIGVDLGAQAQDAIRFMGERLGSALHVGVLLPRSDEVLDTSDPILEGVRRGIAQYPGARIASIIPVRPSLLSGEESAAILLNKHPDINAILAPNASLAEGTAQVLVDLGLVGTIMIVGFDLTEEVSRLLDNGVIDAVVVSDADTLGRVAVGALFSTDEAMPKRQIGYTLSRGSRL